MEPNTRQLQEKVDLGLLREIAGTDPLYSGILNILIWPPNFQRRQVRGKMAEPNYTNEIEKLVDGNIFRAFGTGDRCREKGKQYDAVSKLSNRVMDEYLQQREAIPVPMSLMHLPQIDRAEWEAIETAHVIINHPHEDVEDVLEARVFTIGLIGERDSGHRNGYRYHLSCGYFFNRDSGEVSSYKDVLPISRIREYKQERILKR